jgi:hypothetical protein
MSPSSLQQLQELFVSQSGLFDSIFEKADLQLSVSGKRKNTAIRHLDVNVIALAASPDTPRFHEGPNRFFVPGERVRPLMPSRAELHHLSCAACGQSNPAARGHILTVKRLLIEQPTVIDLPVPRTAGREDSPSSVWGCCRLPRIAHLSPASLRRGRSCWSAHLVGAVPGAGVRLPSPRLTPVCPEHPYPVRPILPPSGWVIPAGCMPAASVGSWNGWGRDRRAGPKDANS